MASSNFQLYMFDEDIKRIKTWVLQYPDLETGGSLFGLWTSGHNPVAHIVLGPGKESKRTGVSFFQDISYLERVGNLLTHEYMLCHIGEWHSHHRLRLYEPSGGDVSTVVRNYPEGVCGFVLMIANIISEKDVSLSPYMFTEDSCSRRSGARYKSGEIVTLKGDSPFRIMDKINQNINYGEEVVIMESGHRYPSTTRRVQVTSTSAPAPVHSNVVNTNEHRSAQKDVEDNLGGQKGPRSVKLQHVVKGDEQETAAEPMDTSNPSDEKSTIEEPVPVYYDKTDLITQDKTTSQGAEVYSSPRRDCEIPNPGIGEREVRTTHTGAAVNTPNIPKNNINDGFVNSGFVEHQNRSPLQARRVPMAPTEKVLPIPWVGALTNPRQWYEGNKGEEDLKTIHHSLCQIADALNVGMSRDSNTHDLTMSFLHHGTKWIIQFPSDFPHSATKLKEEQYSANTGRYFNATVLVLPNEELIEILRKVKDTVITSCNECNNARQAEANWSQRTQSQ